MEGDIIICGEDEDEEECAEVVMAGFCRRALNSSPSDFTLLTSLELSLTHTLTHAKRMRDRKR